MVLILLSILYDDGGGCLFCVPWCLCDAVYRCLLDACSVIRTTTYDLRLTYIPAAAAAAATTAGVVIGPAARVLDI